MAPFPATQCAPARAGTGRDWSGTRVLLTGATGFIGSHLARRLRALGAQVHVVSRRPPEDGRLWHAADLADTEATNRLVRSTCPDVVYHLASAVTGVRDVKAVLPTLSGNLAGAVNLMTAVTGTGAKVVLAGSVEEPRAGDTVPQSPYAAAKWAATGYARMFHELWNVPVSVLRVAMVYGPAQPDTTKLLPYVIRSLLRYEPPLLSSGRRQVDWVYVDDVVDAFISAGETDGAAGRVLDIGSGVLTSIRDIIMRVAGIVGSPVRPRFGALSDRPLDRELMAEPELADRLLGWRATTGLDTGLRRTVEWYAATL